MRLLFFLIFFLSNFLGTAQLISTNLADINKIDSQGRKQGVWVGYMDSMVVESIKTYKNDTLEGYFEHYWYSNGIVSECGFYKSGQLDNIVIGYWDNGQIRGVVPYKMGKIDGIVTSYTKSGELATRELFVNGIVDTTYEDTFISPTIEWDAHGPVRKDTIVEVLNEYNKRVAIYRNNKIKKMYNLRGEEKINESWYDDEGQEVTRIIYCRKRKNCVKKIFYFYDDVLIKTIIVNEKCKKKLCKSLSDIKLPAGTDHVD